MADYSWVEPLINAGASVLSNAESNRMSEEDKARYKAILAKLGALESPDFDVNPLTAEAGTEDPQLRALQLQSLAGLGEIQRSGGLTLADQAAQNKAMNQTARQESAGRNAIQARMDARGTGSSGANLAMQLSNNQSAANRASEVGMNTAASAQRRYIDSILKQGQMAGQMSDRDMRAKKARDVMNQYNQKNRNVQGQQGFQNNVTKITGQMPGTNAMIGLNQAQSGRNSDFITGMGAGIGSLATDGTRDRGQNAPSGSEQQFEDIESAWDEED